MHKDLRAIKSFGIHWGTFKLTLEVRAVVPLCFFLNNADTAFQSVHVQTHTHTHTLSLSLSTSLSHSLSLTPSLSLDPSFRLCQPYLEPKTDLAEQGLRAGLPEDAFTTFKHGETRCYYPQAPVKDAQPGDEAGKAEADAAETQTWHL